MRKLVAGFLLLGLVQNCDAQKIISELINTIPVIRYSVPSGETLRETLLKFSVTFDQFKQLNGDEPSNGSVLLPVMPHMLVDEAQQGIPFYFKASRHESAEKVAQIFNLKPELVRKRNSMFPGNLRGREYFIGYLPADLFEWSDEARAGKDGSEANEATTNTAATDVKFEFGAFVNDYEPRTVASRQGKLGFFKSTSGYDNGQFYILLSQVAPGTVVKVQNQQNGRYIFARVLAAMPAIKNELAFARLSSAGYAVLTAGSEAPYCDVIIE